MITPATRLDDQHQAEPWQNDVAANLNAILEHLRDVHQWVDKWSSFPREDFATLAAHTLRVVERVVEFESLNTGTPVPSTIPDRAMFAEQPIKGVDAFLAVSTNQDNG